LMTKGGDRAGSSWVKDRLSDRLRRTGDPISSSERKENVRALARLTLGEIGGTVRP
jgi:hypothetical protein